MGKHKNTSWEGAGAQKSASPTTSSHRGEVSDRGNAFQDLRDDMDSLEGGMSWMGTSPELPFRFVQSSQSPSKWSLMPEHQHITQYMKIKHAIVSMLECLWGREEAISPHLAMHGVVH